MKGVAYQSPSPTKPSDNLPIHFIELTYYNDGLLDESIIIEIENDYEPSIDNIIKRGCKAYPLIVITASARANTHTPSMESIESTCKIPKVSIKHTFEEIDVIAKYAMSITLHKTWIENNEPLPIDTQPSNPKYPPTNK